MTLLLMAPLAMPQSLTDDKNERVDRIVSGWVGTQAPGFAVMVRNDGKTVFARGYGIREQKTRAKVDEHTDFRLASCTKQFTAMAIMLLVHDGKLRYDEKLTDVFPDFPAYGKAITIRNLLNHSSGLPDYEELMEQAQPRGKPPKWTAEHQISDAEVLELLKEGKQGRFAPGTEWSYSNSGYVTLGLIVAKVSGKPFPDFLRERIFAPLKMENTVAFVRGKNEVPNRAFGHSKSSTTATGETNFRETDQSSTSATLGDGGVYSNLADLAKWDDALAHHTLLSAKEMEPALKPFTKPDGSLPKYASGPGDTDPLGSRPVEYGFGWFLDKYKGHARMWHYGDTTGFKSAIFRFENGLSIVVLANASDVDVTALVGRIADIYLVPNK